MASDVQVVVVSAGSPPDSLLEALRTRGLVVHACGISDAEEEIDSFAPDLVVLTGVRGAMELTTLLDDDTRRIRPRLAIVAKSRELTQLRGLNRQLVVSVLTQELGDRMVSERLETLARKWAKVRDDAPVREQLPTISAGSFEAEVTVVVESRPSNAIPEPIEPFQKLTEPPKTPAAPPVAPAPPFAKTEGSSGNGPIELGASLLESIPASLPVRASQPNFEALADQALGILDELESDPHPGPFSPRVTSALHTGFTPSAPEANPPRGPSLSLKAALSPKEPPSVTVASSSLLESVPPSELDDLELVDADSIRPPTLPPEASTPPMPDLRRDAPPALAAEEALAGTLVSPKEAFASTVALDAPLDFSLDRPALEASPAAAPAVEASEPVAPEASFPERKTSEVVTESTSGSVLSTRPEPFVLSKRQEPGPAARGLAPESAPAKKSTGALPLVAALVLGLGGVAYYQLNHESAAPRAKKDSPAAVVQSSGSEKSESAAPDVAAPKESDRAAAPTPSASADAPTPAPEETVAAPKPVAFEGNPYAIREVDLPKCSSFDDPSKVAPPDPKYEASLHWKAARESIVKGELVRANVSMCEAVRLHPESPALEGLAMLYLTRGAPSEALVWVERAEKARPGVRETATLRGDILSFLGRPEDALATWLAALNIPPEDGARRRGVANEDTTLGRKFLKQGDLPRAERMLRRAVALDPENAIAAASLAETMKKRENPVGAAFFAQRSLAIFPMNPDCELILGDLALEAGDRATAKAHYEKAVSIRSDFWSAKMKLRALEEK